jgi:integrase
MVLVLAYTGLRWGECAALRVEGLDLLHRKVNVVLNAVEVGSKVHVGTPKNHRTRTVPLPRFLLKPLARQCEGKARADLLFPGTGGEHMRPPRGTGGWFAGAVKRSGVPRITPHGLRHTSASLAVSAGANVKSGSAHARTCQDQHDAGRPLGPVPRGSGRRGGRVRPRCAGPGCGFLWENSS